MTHNASDYGYSIEGQLPSAEDLRYHHCDRGERWAEYDGYGIFLTYVCDKCVEAKMSQFRDDIHEHYEADEPIEPEDY